jgi:hypothetical protein
VMKKDDVKAVFGWVDPTKVKIHNPDREKE